MITAKYKGKYYDIEYSIVNVSKLEGELRLDAEYYDPYYLKIEEKIKSKNWLPIQNLLVEKPQYGSTPEGGVFEKSGIPFIRSQDLKDGFVEINQFCKKEFHEKNNKSKVIKGDILLAVIGATIGEVAIYLQDEEANINQNIARLRFSNINAYYTFSFMNTNYFKAQLYKFNTGNAQPYINTFQILSFIIPIPSETFQKLIEKLVLKAYEERQKAEDLYKQAEETLLEELGLKNWKPKTKKIKIGGTEFEEEENISIRMLSDILKVDRMDAEYWEPRYDEIEKIIKNYKNGYSIISKEFLHKTTKLKINKNDYYNYIEISSVNVSNGDFLPSFLKGEDLPANAKLKIGKNDLIISKVRTYRKGIALINKSYPNLIGSSAFTVLHEKEDNRFNIETLFIFLRTNIFSLWSYKFYTGTSYPTLTDDDILNLPIPLIDNKTQQKIASLVQQSFKARENSKKLLEISKRAVEIYIEKDEVEGQKYINEHLQEMKVKI